MPFFICYNKDGDNMKIEDLPKIELHVHLDGSLSTEMAKRISLKDDDYILNNMIAKEKCEDLNEYLTKFSFPCDLLQSKKNLELFSSELAKDLEKDNVIYAEVRFAPLKHLNEGLSPDEVVESVISGLRTSKTKINVILCMMRNDAFSENLKVIDLAKKYLGNGVVGIDLAGAEALYPTEDFIELFNIARSKGIPFTIHAGEADGVSSINSAILCHTNRIGHGIRCIEDKDVMKTIRDNNILLEVCPTSNIQTNVVDKINNHPIKYLIENGIKVCINTDNRTVSNTTLSKEYKMLINELGLSIEDIINCNMNAIEGSFLSEEEKEYLMNKYRAFL